MSHWDKLKIVVFILLPINAWLGIFYYLHWQRQRALREAHERFEREAAVVYQHYQERLGLKVGQPLRYPFPYPTNLIGRPPPIGQGIPVLFINISWIADSEVWQPALEEAWKASPYLHIVLLYRKSESHGLEPISKMLRKLNNPRLTVIAGREWIASVFGTDRNGTLLILCDGNGIVLAIEPYPDLKVSPYWDDEVADWRPKLHQAVKKVLDKFFPKSPYKGR